MTRTTYLQGQPRPKRTFAILIAASGRLEGAEGLHQVLLSYYQSSTCYLKHKGCPPYVVFSQQYSHDQHSSELPAQLSTGLEVHPHPASRSALEATVLSGLLAQVHVRSPANKICSNEQHARQSFYFPSRRVVMEASIKFKFKALPYPDE